MKHGGNERLQVEYSGRMTTREEVAWACADDDNGRKGVSKLGGRVGSGSDLGLRCSATVIIREVEQLVFLSEFRSKSS